MRYLRLRQPNNDSGDYVKEQEELYKDFSVSGLKRWIFKQCSPTVVVPIAIVPLTYPPIFSSKFYQLVLA